MRIRRRAKEEKKGFRRGRRREKEVEVKEEKAKEGERGEVEGKGV